MSVKIITDSTSDIPEELAKELDITIIPQYVIFGNKCFKDRVDISADEFYDKLIHDSIQPTTSQPTLQDFLDVYNELSKNYDGIVSIHISTGLSGTINSAEQAKKLTSAKCPIAVIDSKKISMALGIAVITAAKLAKAGNGFQEIVDEVHKMIPCIHEIVMFDTLEYLARGGRIGKARSFVGSLLDIKPILTLKDGEFAPVQQVRSKDRAKKKLLEFATNFNNIVDICGLHSTNSEEIAEMVKKIPNFPTEHIILSRMGPVIGTHTGPGVLALVVRTSS
jgi:DegV family protein with EDD domain